MDEVKNTIYVANSMGNSVSIIDGNTNQVVNTLAVTGKPMDVAVDPSISQAYVSTAGNITVIDTASQTLKTNISIPAGTPSLNRIAVNKITHQVYVSTTNLLVVIDGSANKIMGMTSNTTAVSSMALDDVTNKLYLDSWTYFGDSMTKTMSGDHKVDVADLSNMIITTTSPSIPSALNILSTVIFSWTAPLQLNMILVTGDIVVVDTAPRTTTPPPPPSNTPPPLPKQTGLTISPTSATIYIYTKNPVKGKQQYTAKDGNGANITNSVSWQSDKPTIAVINTTGLAAPPLPLSTATPGIATITASANGVVSSKAELCVDCWEYTHYRQNVGTWINDPFGMNWGANSVRPINQQDLDSAPPPAIYTAKEFGGNISNVSPATTVGIYKLGIAGKGCHMTCWAMALTAAGVPITPGQLNLDLQNNDGYTDQNEPDVVVIKTLYPAAKIDYVDYNTNIDTLFQNCDMVIIKLGPSGPQQSTLSSPLHPVNHFVLAVKKQNGKYKIYDPWLMRDNSGNILDNAIQLDDLDDPVRQLLRSGYSYKGIKLKKI